MTKTCWLWAINGSFLVNFALVACAWFCFSGMSPKLGSPSETQTKLLKFHMLMEEPLKNWCPPIKTPIFSQKSCPTALENSRIPSGLMSEISIVGCFLAGTVRFKGMYKLTDWIYIYIYTIYQAKSCTKFTEDLPRLLVWFHKNGNCGGFSSILGDGSQYAVLATSLSSIPSPLSQKSLIYEFGNSKNNRFFAAKQLFLCFTTWSYPLL